jgi:hypothetical protein
MSCFRREGWGRNERELPVSTIFSYAKVPYFGVSWTSLAISKDRKVRFRESTFPLDQSTRRWQIQYLSSFLLS